MSVNEKMTAIADAIRTKTGGTEPLGLDAMAEAIAAISGLPDAIAVVDGGTITPTSNINRQYWMDHNLGVVPDFFYIVVADAKYSPLPNYDFFVNQIYLRRSSCDGSKIYTMFGQSQYYNKTSKVVYTGSGNYDNVSTYMTDKQIYIQTYTEKPMTPNNTYVWVCGKFSTAVN
jgi:hypothetical protein